MSAWVLIVVRVVVSGCCWTVTADEGVTATHSDCGRCLTAGVTVMLGVHGRDGFDMYTEQHCHTGFVVHTGILTLCYSHAGA